MHLAQEELFSYQIDLERRVRADHPLRAIRRTVDFGFVRQAVAHCYGHGRAKDVGSNRLKGGAIGQEQ